MESKTDVASKVVTGHRTPVVTITVTAVFTALVFLSTYLFQIPILQLRDTSISETL